MNSACAVLVLCLCAVTVVGHYSIWIHPNEALKVLGLSTELYYVKEGKPNQYALGFPVVVHANVSELHFTWQSFRSPVPYYEIAVIANNDEALGEAKLNISHSGSIPKSRQVFRVVLPCTGRVIAEVDVNIHINITLNRNLTTINIQRKKVCTKADKKDDSDNGTMMMDASVVVNDPNPVYIAVGCATSIVVVMAILATICYCQSQKARRAEAMRLSQQSSVNKFMEWTKRQTPVSDESNCNGITPSITSQAQTFLRVDTPNNSSTVASYSSYRKLSPLPMTLNAYVQTNEIRASDLSEQISEIAVDRRKISVLEKLREGTFGQIHHGLLLEDSNEIGAEQHVFIKTISDQASKVQISLFLTEGMKMFAMNHTNVLPVIAACMDNPSRPLLLYPYMNEGNLKSFLKSSKFSPDGHCHVLVTQDLVHMAIQLAQGTMYLHKRNCIHRDIAARNCVVDDRLNVKITDSALSRDLFPNDYHCLGDNENRPVKWLALESLILKEFTPASDVWMYGVTLWELMTLGQQPYIEVDAFEMAGFLRDGYRLAQPINCPDELFTLMDLCWQPKPDDRPSFPYLLQVLIEFYTALGRYI